MEGHVEFYCPQGNVDDIKNFKIIRKFLKPAQLENSENPETNEFLKGITLKDGVMLLWQTLVAVAILNISGHESQISLKHIVHPFGWCEKVYYKGYLLLCVHDFLNNLILWRTMQNSFVSLKCKNVLPVICVAPVPACRENWSLCLVCLWVYCYCGSSRAETTDEVSKILKLVYRFRRPYLESSCKAGCYCLQKRVEAGGTMMALLWAVVKVHRTR